MPEIRDAKPDDALDVAGVHVRAWQLAYRGIFPDSFLDGLSVEERAARYTLGSSDPTSPQTIVALRDNAIIGFATVGACRDDDARDAAELCALYVDPPSWGSGVGRLLMAEVHRRVVAGAYERAVLWVLEANIAARRFYERDRWTPDEARRTEDIWGVAADVMRYSRSLASTARPGPATGAS